MTNALIQEAVNYAGGQSALAKLCGKKQGHVWGWLHANRVTADVAVLIDAATDGVVSKAKLRPDLFT